MPPWASTCSLLSTINNHNFYLERKLQWHHIKIQNVLIYNLPFGHTLVSSPLSCHRHLAPHLMIHLCIRECHGNNNYLALSSYSQRQSMIYDTHMIWQSQSSTIINRIEGICHVCVKLAPFLLLQTLASFSNEKKRDSPRPRSRFWFTHYGPTNQSKYRIKIVLVVE